MPSSNDDIEQEDDILCCFFDVCCSIGGPSIGTGKRMNLKSRIITIAAVIFAIVVILTTTLLTIKNKDDSKNGKFTFIVVCLYFLWTPSFKG